MKELSIEEKARRYDEVLPQLKGLLDGVNEEKCDITEEDITKIFPELAESEDERIIKAIKSAVLQLTDIYLQEKYGLKQSDCIAWLEKQCEHANFRNKIQIGDKVTRNEDGVLVNLSQLSRGAKQGEQIFANSAKTCKDEQKYNPCDECVNRKGCINCENGNMKETEQKSVDKIEPKFHKGEWIVHHGTKNIYQVVAIIDNQYQLKYCDNYTTQYCEDVDRCTRLWDITKDAKDGDVLYMNNGLSTCTFIYKSIDNVIIQKYASYNKFGFEGTTYLVLNDGYVCPATKEQRDLLFQKMKEAGYEWDAEKKELKKIEFSPDDLIEENYQQQADDLIDMVTEKPAWSEEDEYCRNQLIVFCENCMQPDSGAIRCANWLKSLKDRVLPQPKQEWSKEDYNDMETIACHLDNTDNEGLAEVLRNIRDKYYHIIPQSTWKPSDEQMAVLNEVINYAANSELQHWSSFIYTLLKSLREQLKKLKEDSYD